MGYSFDWIITLTTTTTIFNMVPETRPKVVCISTNTLVFLYMKQPWGEAFTRDTHLSSVPVDG